MLFLSYNLDVFENRCDDAIEILKSTTEVFPESSQAFFLLGDAYARKSDFERAVECFDRAVDLNPKDTDAIERLEKLRDMKDYQ